MRDSFSKWRKKKKILWCPLYFPRTEPNSKLYRLVTSEGSLRLIKLAETHIRMEVSALSLGLGLGELRCGYCTVYEKRENDESNPNHPLNYTNYDVLHTSLSQPKDHTLLISAGGSTGISTRTSNIANHFEGGLYLKLKSNCFIFHISSHHSMPSYPHLPQSDPRDF